MVASRERYLTLITTLLWLAGNSKHVGGLPPYHAVYHHELPELGLTVEEELVLDDDLCPTRPRFTVIEGGRHLPPQALLAHPLAGRLEQAGVVLTSMLKEHNAHCEETGEDASVIPEDCRNRLRARSWYLWRGTSITFARTHVLQAGEMFTLKERLLREGRVNLEGAALGRERP